MFNTCSWIFLLRVDWNLTVSSITIRDLANFRRQDLFDHEIFSLDLKKFRKWRGRFFICIRVDLSSQQGFLGKYHDLIMSQGFFMPFVLDVDRSTKSSDGFQTISPK